MATAKHIHKKGANITVVASAEVLGLPGGDVDRWLSKVSNTVGAQVSAAAPTNKRPRWWHHGTRLKKSIEVNGTEFRPSKGGFRLYSSVGSSVPHAYYVDQGTKGFNAVLLPPWKQMGYQFHEAAWRPGFPFINNGPVGTIPVSGQRGQQFFAKGLGEAFRRVHMATRDGSEGEPKIADTMRRVPYGLENFKGNTPWSMPFQAQREIWRKERDSAWWAESDYRRRAQAKGKKYGRRNRNYTRKSDEDRRLAAAQASKRYRDATYIDSRGVRVSTRKEDILESQRYRRGQRSRQGYLEDLKLEREARALTDQPRKRKSRALSDAQKKANAARRQTPKQREAAEEKKRKASAQRARARTRDRAVARKEQIQKHGGTATLKPIRDSFNDIIGYTVSFKLPSGHKITEPYYT